MSYPFGCGRDNIPGILTYRYILWSLRNQPKTNNSGNTVEKAKLLFFLKFGYSKINHLQGPKMLF